MGSLAQAQSIASLQLTTTGASTASSKGVCQVSCSLTHAGLDRQRAMNRTSDIKSEFEANGFVKGQGLLEIREAVETFNEHIKKARRETQTHFNHYKVSDPGMNPHLRSKNIWKTIFNEQVIGDAKQILGNEFVCLNTIIVDKAPRSNRYLTPHQDEIYWGLREPEALSVWIALTKATKENGCMRIYTGTHTMKLKHKTTHDPNNILQMGEECRWVQEPKRVVNIELNPGEYNLHHCMAVHDSQPNQSDNWRVGLVGRFASLKALTQEYRESRLYINCSDIDREEKNKPAGEFENDKEEKFKHIHHNRQYYRKLHEQYEINQTKK